VSNAQDFSPILCKRVSIELQDRAYDVLVGTGLLAKCGPLIRGVGLGGKCAVVTDSIVLSLYGEAIVASLYSSGFAPLIVEVPAGENSKSLVQVEAVCDRMIEAGFDRKSFVVALGGGVVGDLAGFVAAIYYRGIPYVQIPTTIIAQVDSAVGGKTGVNAAGGKNLIGAFHQPRIVLADIALLASLPPRERNQGYAEIIKHGIIRDREMLASLESSGDEDLTALIARNVAIKAAIVVADEFETTGERALLNFGHTIGHAIENAAGYGRYFHGEAISLGLVAACELSVQLAGLRNSARDLVVNLLRRHNLPIQLPHDIPTESIIEAMKTDKKFARGEIRFVLSAALGSAFVSRDVTMADIESAIDALRPPK
jgi:3-dehydroquinate synthase